MTTSVSLLGSVETNNIRLGAARCYCAPYSTYIDETVKFDTANPPAPWLDLGPSQYNNALSFTQNYYKYMVGVPKVLKAKRKIDIDFTIQVTLDQFSGANLARAVYNTNYAIKNYASAPAIVVASAIPSGNVVQLPSSTSWLENQYIGLAASSGGLANTTDEYKIVEISGNYLLLDRNVATAFGSAPYAGMIESWKVPFGTSKPCNIAFLLVFDDTDRGQLVIVIPNGVIDGNFTMNGIPAQSNAIVPITVTGQAFYDIDIADNSIANIIRFAA